MVLVRLPNHSNLTRMNKQYSLKTAPTATSKEQKSQNRPKAKRMVIGVDVHLKSYHAACKIDNGVIGAVAKFRSQTELLLHIEKQRKGAEQFLAQQAAQEQSNRRSNLEQQPVQLSQR